ncbi:MAG: hypothetical protein GY710_11135 [Desulfobacteraceae bacterium]|nr:hypothetical protein [Desulfobacteraceae bacterium]
MDINNIEAIGAYSTDTQTSAPTEDTLVREENQRAAQADLDQETARAAQQAFEVNLTQEARDLSAAENSPAQTTAAPDQNPEPDPRPSATQETSQIVNIVA